jgi:N-acetylglucosaminyl-diphospho-decaprenol L-rhamnosyltransferase
MTQGAALHPQPRVLIAIVSTNEVHNLVGCLRCLTVSTHANFNVIICENGGSKGLERTQTTLSGLDFVRVLATPPIDEVPPAWTLPYYDFGLDPGRQRVTVLNPMQNLGYAGGVNACIAAAKNWRWDAVWVLNPDTFPEPDALAALVRRQEEGQFGVVGSRLVFASSGLVQTWGGLEWRSWLGRGRLIGADQPAEATPDVADVERRIAFISGASMYVSRGYVEAVGVMDEDFFVFDEDVDWCLRRGPFKLGYAHQSVIRHVHGSASGSSSNKAKRSHFNVYLTERNRILLARKRFGIGWGIVAAIALAQTHLEYLVQVKSIRQFCTALEGWWAGIRGETGPPKFMRGTNRGKAPRPIARRTK